MSLDRLKDLERNFVIAIASAENRRTPEEIKSIKDYQNELMSLLEKGNKNEEEINFIKTYLHTEELTEPAKSALKSVQEKLNFDTSSSKDDQRAINQKKAPHGLTGVMTMESLFDDNIERNVLLIPTDSDFKIVSATPPGIMTRDELKQLTKPITEMAIAVFERADNKTINATIQAILQMIVLTQTSIATLASDVEDIEVMLDGKSYNVSYGMVRDTISKPFTGSNKPNSLRRFGRAMSPSIITGISNGTFKVNVKVMAKWGVPKMFYPYTVDCTIPEDGRDGLAAVLAKILATIIAIKQNQSLKSNTIHNALEQSSGGLKILDSMKG